MKHIRTFAGWILFVEVILASVLIVGLVVPLPGKVELKIVQSGSMTPVLPVGSVVMITPATTYGVGDIITFGKDTSKRIPTTHRIVGTERVDGVLHYQTKGDANEEADNALVPHSAVIGSVAVTVPRLGFVLDFARSREGFFLMIVIPALLVIVDELFTIVKTVRERRQPVRQSVRTGMSRQRVHTSQLRRVSHTQTSTYTFRQSVDGMMRRPLHT